ncbi:MAG: helix-turn-helix domain-containing protein [Treponema sp.]|jgi:transcriptional regulator with XRE-family HTH domain|nr:helix-turn-helix domain-containing protein [Treponema sp.]
MTHFQAAFIKNLRFFRKKKGISQVKFSELINISPNYLNAVENGKNFPSPELIQGISNALDILPFQLFLEQPMELSPGAKAENSLIIQELIRIKQKFIFEIDDLIQKYEYPHGTPPPLR